MHPVAIQEFGNRGGDVDVGTVIVVGNDHRLGVGTWTLKDSTSPGSPTNRSRPDPLRPS